MRKITEIKINKPKTILCTLDNGESIEYSMGFIDADSSEMVIPLKDPAFFSKVFIEYGSLSWPNGYDIHVNTVIRDGVKLSKAAS